MNLFNRMYNGKNRSDFTSDQLPDNRLKLFFEMLKTRFFKLSQLNMLFLVFLLPLAFFLFGFIMNIPYIAEGEVLARVNELLLYCIPCMGVMGIGLTGLTYVARNWARDEHAWVFSDYLDAVKANWKQGLIMGLLNGALMLVMVVALEFYYLQSATNLLYYVLFWLMLVMMLVLAIANLYIWPMMIGYELKLRQILRNSLILALGRLPWSLLFLVITLIPVAILLLIPQATIGVVLYYVLIGFALHVFINVSYTNAAFDRFINVKIEGAPVNMGLRAEDDDDYEDDED